MCLTVPLSMLCVRVYACVLDSMLLFLCYMSAVSHRASQGPCVCVILLVQSSIVVVSLQSVELPISL